MACLIQAHIEESKLKGFTKLYTFWTKHVLRAITEALNSLEKESKLNDVATEDDGTTHTSENLRSEKPFPN